MEIFNLMTRCDLCGEDFQIEDGHTCPEPAEVPANLRRQSNSNNIMWALLTRADKEQLDRIEAKLDRIELRLSGIDPSLKGFKPVPLDGDDQR